MSEMIYYCEICAMRKEFKGKLPLRHIPITGTEPIAGYCRLCGESGLLLGCITMEEAETRGVTVPTLQELSDRNDPLLA